MPAKINKAMILAAGRGTRMRELTDALPKPLIAVNGRTLIDRIADKIAAQGIRDCVVNVCYLGDKIKANFAKRSDLNFVYSDEESALETGGGVKKALPLLNDSAFFVLNADPAWTERGMPALQKMEQAWNPDLTDALLLLVPMTRVFGHDGTGDYLLDERGKPHRKAAGTTAPYVFAGAQILKKSLFDDSPDGKFSLNVLYDKAEKAGRLSAVVLDGDWYHVGTPEALTIAEQNLK